MAVGFTATTLPREAAGPNEWAWVRAFVLLQFLAPVLLFLPGMQPLRPLIRAIPYVSSLAMLLRYAGKPSVRSLPPGGRLVALALVLLALNLCHPASHSWAGLAQCVFQLSIAAPVFWAAKAIGDERNLERLLWLVLLATSGSAVVGVLQVYYPESFMPPEFSSLGLSLNPHILHSLSYVGADGQQIIRPPGLSDMPGGAALAGTIVAVMGLILGVQAGQPIHRRAFCFAMAGVGMFDLFLTQVRSLFLMMLVAVVVMCFLLARQRRFTQSYALAGAAAGLVVGAFLWATTVGGESVSKRFLGLFESSPVMSYQQNRGHFVESTFSQVFYDYPLGAGVGRWGMMCVYFGSADARYPPIHVEIQLTGWLLDGGVLMWFFYGGAIVASLAYTYHVSTHARSPRLAYAAAIIFCMNLLIVGQAMAGPSFNTQMGIQFWLLAAALHGAAGGAQRRPEPARQGLALRHDPAERPSVNGASV